jgi:hypothetical protein
MHRLPGSGCMHSVATAQVACGGNVMPKPYGKEFNFKSIKNMSDFMLLAVSLLTRPFALGCVNCLGFFSFSGIPSADKIHFFKSLKQGKDAIR